MSHDLRKVAFYIDNRTVSNIDCSDILHGNPGIGGTEFMIVTIATLLSLRSNGLSVTMYSTCEGKYPQGLDVQVVRDFRAAVRTACDTVQDYLIFKHEVEHIHDHSLEGDFGRLKFIAWCHVFLCHWELDYYASNDRIWHIVNVGREMNDLYRDHRSFLKSDYIYNCVDLQGCNDRVKGHPFETRKNIVVYMGSISPFKGFHFLAKAWPEVLRQVPDAELYVIGSGRLYNRNAALGDHGITESSYEKYILGFLSQDGKILPGVHFMGVMGKEKEEILLQSKVGVPNPSGITETFGISAVEMQKCGARIVTRRCPGHLDTVFNGVLYSNPSQLAAQIVSAFRNDGSGYDTAMQHISSLFSQDAVASRWEELLLNGTLPADDCLSHPFYRMKFLKEFRRWLSLVCPILYKVPPIERILLFMEKHILGSRIRYIDSNTVF